MRRALRRIDRKRCSSGLRLVRERLRRDGRKLRVQRLLLDQKRRLGLKLLPVRRTALRIARLCNSNIRRRDHRARQRIRNRTT